MVSLKRLIKAVGILGIVFPAYGGTVTPPAGSYINNVSTTASVQIFRVSSGTITGQLTVGSCSLIGGGSCGSGGGGGSSLPLPGGATNYVQISNSLQASSTFYVSSGTVATKLNAGAISINGDSSGNALGVNGTANFVNNVFENQAGGGYFLGPSMNFNTGFLSDGNNGIKIRTNGTDNWKMLSNTAIVINSSETITSPLGISNTYGITTGSITLNNVASGTQCLHADSSGHVTGTGSDCGAGGGSPGGSTTQLQYNSTGTFAGLGGSVITTSSVSLNNLALTASTITVNGTGDGSITETIGGVTYTVTSSSITPTAGHIASWSGTGTLIDGGTGGGGGSFINNQNTLQSGATFYVSSGTANNFYASSTTLSGSYNASSTNELLAMKETGNGGFSTNAGGIGFYLRNGSATDVKMSKIREAGNSFSAGNEAGSLILEAMHAGAFTSPARLTIFGANSGNLQEIRTNAPIVPETGSTLSIFDAGNFSTANLQFGQNAGNGKISWVYPYFSTDSPWVFTSSESVRGNLYISSGVLLSGSAGTNGQVLTSGGAGTVPTWQTPSGGGSTVSGAAFCPPPYGCGLNPSYSMTVTSATPRCQEIVPAYNVQFSSVSFYFNDATHTVDVSVAYYDSTCGTIINKTTATISGQHYQTLLFNTPVTLTAGTKYFECIVGDQDIATYASVTDSGFLGCAVNDGESASNYHVFAAGNSSTVGPGPVVIPPSTCGVRSYSCGSGSTVSIGHH